MRIAIVGAGNVGTALGAAWAVRGHEIVLGVRDPGSGKSQAAEAATRGRAVSVASAVSSADAILLATPWPSTQQAVAAMGDITGKILIDATNPIALGIEGLRAGLVIGHDTSGAETIAGWVRGGLVVKAFNTIGAANMSNPLFAGGPASMLICGDDAGAKDQVRQLSDELGFATEDAGPLAVARLLEPMAMLWIHLAYMQGWGTQFAFKVARR